MRTVTHPLPATTGTTRHLLSLHFGHSESGRKVYLQAGLHADEWPPLLVAQHLKQQLVVAEAEGRLRAEVVLVPFANPVGLGQVLLGQAIGRFDFTEGRNFNRGFPYLTPAARTKLTGTLGPDPEANRRAVVAALRVSLEAEPAVTDAAATKRLLMQLAFDADVALDLHCDHEALLHVYAGTPHAARAAALAGYLGAAALITAKESGDHPFDEALARPWWELADSFGPRHPIARGCLSATVELRGQHDVNHALAASDATALLRFLAHEGLIEATDDPAAHRANHPANQPAAPPACAATPLEGVEPIIAPHAGIVVHTRALGEHIAAGEPVVELIDPASGDSTLLRASHGGVLYARHSTRFAVAGMRLAKLAGAVPFRSGLLLSE